MSRSKDIAGKKVLITGAAGGIGKAIAELFVQEGATLVLFDINAANLERTGEEFTRKYRAKVFTMPVDVTDYAAFKAAVDEVVEKVGMIDIFINNAGVGISGEIVRNTVEEIDTITGVNYLGMVYGSKIILEKFYKQGHGHLVNVASVAGIRGCPRMSLYCGTKAGIVAFTQGIRFEAERHGVDVSVVMPSTTDTPMITGKMGEDAELIPGVLLAIPLCKTEKVAKAAFDGILAKKFMIFPTWMDFGSVIMRNFTPWFFDIFIRLVGFNDFKAKRDKMMAEQLEKQNVREVK